MVRQVFKDVGSSNNVMRGIAHFKLNFPMTAEYGPLPQHSFCNSLVKMSMEDSFQFSIEVFILPCSRHRTLPTENLRIQWRLEPPLTQSLLVKALNRLL